MIKLLVAMVLLMTGSVIALQSGEEIIGLAFAFAAAIPTGIVLEVSCRQE